MGSSLKLKINVAPALDVSALNIDEYEELSQEPRPDSDLSRVHSKPEPEKIFRNVNITFIISVNFIIN